MKNVLVIGSINIDMVIETEKVPQMGETLTGSGFLTTPGGKGANHMKKLGLYDLTPALCRLDYTMSEAGGATDFVRQYTLASGGPYCDCGYKKKGFVKAGTEAGR